MIAAILLTAASTARLTDPQILLFGRGGMSCAAALTPTQALGSADWVAGFWSALNAERNSQVGHNTDFAGIFVEVQNRCRGDASLQFVTAVYQTYEAMAHRGR
jgi:hypothetical protein